MLARLRELVVKFGRVVIGALLTVSSVGGINAWAQNVDSDTVPEIWVLKPRVSFDARARYQSTQRAGLQDGEALTLRIQAAAELDLGHRTTAIGEIEAVVGLIADFNDGTRPDTGLPFIPDPDGIELNRLALISEAIEDVRVTVGRQRLALDDWRFIGAFPFRQNDQTFDAVRVETTALGPGTLDVGYFGRVLRPLGDDNPVGRFTGDSLFANYNFATPIGRVTAYHYRFDIETGPEGPSRHIFSNKVSGARLFGRRHWENSGVVWDFGYARQADYSDNPTEFETEYKLAELTFEQGKSGLTLRAEVLGSDNGQGFQTPLGSLHRFQGLADQFLRTPEDGIRDVSVLVRHDLNRLGPFRNIRVFARHHWFAADATELHYGTEFDFSISGQVGGINLSLEYADYDAKSFSTDTRSFFLTTQYRF